ncbi:MAG: hypothetical protein AAB242_04655 [Nitrospirota bacterium]
MTYLMLMFAIVLIGITTTAAAKQWKVIVQRELEADLLAKGIEIQNALALYSATMKAGRVVPGEIYPQSLAELTRLPKPFLRKVYGDPMGHGQWDLVRAPTGGIMGVRSKSKGKPIKEKNFPLEVRHFEGRPTYYDWVFQYPNPSIAALAVPGMGAPVSGVPGPPGFSPGGNPILVPNLGDPPTPPMGASTSPTNP